MKPVWQVTVDCARPAALAAFWADVLGYEVDAPPPPYATWAEWCVAHGEAAEQAADGAAISDPDGRRPRIYFQRVPEARTEKNRLHLDVGAGGPRGDPPEVRWARIAAEGERLVGRGARLIRQDDWLGRPHHLVLADPEGHEFCLH